LSIPPNFVFFITDQQRADWLGCYGHPVLKTPNIDAIAAKGTRFENFHVASPVCMPNRASLMTGRYPSVHGLRYNGCRLPLNANTFIDSLANAGYHTAAIGKSHLQPFTGLAPKGRTPEQLAGGAEAWKPDMGDYTHEESQHYQDNERYQIKTPYYGYQHVDMVTTHGDRCGGHYQQWFRQRAPNWEALHDDANELEHNYSCPQAFRTPIPEALYPTAYVRDRAIDYLRSRRESDQPFFVFISFPDPHHPFNPPGKYWDRYSPDEFDVNLPYSSHKNPTVPMKWLHDQWKNGGVQLTPQTAMMLDEQQIKEAMALTAGMMAFVDDAVGDIISCLKNSGHWDKTVICYNSDHGDYLGDYNMILKGALPFRSITRVPFIWSDPDDRSESVTPALASTVDIPSTILDRAGIQPFNGMQGRSFKALIDRKSTSNEASVDNTSIADKSTVRTELFIEYNDGGARLGFSQPARVRTLLTAKWRYTMYRDQDWGELYDLTKDPLETCNLWSDSSYFAVRAKLSERLNHHLAALMDESPLSDRLA